MDKDKLALGGSVLSAIAASLCCIGPLVAVVLGASGFAAAALFAKWRPLFLTITALLLVTAWYLTYWHSKADNCSTDGCARNSVAKWNKIVLWFATAFVIAIAAFPTFSGGAAQLFVPVGASTSGPRACAVGIQAKLNKQDGVQGAQVDFATKTAVIRFDPGKLSPERVTALIDETGFKAEPMTFSQAR